MWWYQLGVLSLTKKICTIEKSQDYKDVIKGRGASLVESFLLVDVTIIWWAFGKLFQRKRVYEMLKFAYTQYI